ncbi:hypothetical protein [Pseudomonas fluorescens]|uniref:Uncharacterized protein n=1 Tax=Pseudomonas fluorescens TaxID=294 RepID=A0A0F4TWS1_PSEFL|nr:hypothetical protein [Pseudomonas fluorescens]KJZ48484.1 hypothetical protein VC34_01930 [Pseudomonas fluorescens]
MNSRIVIGLIVHASACLLYIVLNNYSVPIYKELVGGFTSRGVAIGMGMYFIFYFFAFLNFVLVFINKLSIKFGVALFMMLSILYYMFPQYPIRGMAYCALAGGLTISAILVTRAVDTAFTRWRMKKGVIKP